MTRLSFLALASFVMAFTLLPSGAFAAPYFSLDNLVPPDLMISAPGQQVMYGNGIVMSNLRLADPDFKVAIDDASAFPITPTFHVSAQLTGGRAAGLDDDCDGQVDETPGPGGVYVTEISGLQMSGADMPVGVNIRESPTKASKGGTSCVPVPGGYQLDSFFDIFTELSVDDGMTWWPVVSRSMDGGQTWSDGELPMRIETTPEPATLSLLVLGGAAMLRRRR